MICKDGVTSKQYGGVMNGGRGRALDAIAALSTITIESSADISGQGYRLSFNEDGSRKLTAIARPKGTSIIVQYLFQTYSTRRKYALSQKTQNINEITEVALSYAIAAEIRLTVTIDGKTIVQTTSNKRINRIRTTLDIKITQNLLTGESPLPNWNKDSMIEYYTTSATSKSDGKIFFSVNGRPVIHSKLFRAIRTQYRTIIGQNNPTVILCLKAPRDTYDFIPETKLIGIRFALEEIFISSVSEILKNAWQRRSETLSFDRYDRFSSSNISSNNSFQSNSNQINSNVSEMINEKQSKLLSNIHENFTLNISENINDNLSENSNLSLDMEQQENLKKIDIIRDETLSATKEYVDINSNDILFQFNQAQKFKENFGEHHQAITQSDFSKMDLVGQWNNSFILTRFGGDIYAIDQHAANEAANFEKLRKQRKKGKQILLQPIFLPLSPEDLDNAISHQKAAESVGFSYEIIDNGVSITAIPAGESAALGAEDLKELLGELHDAPNSEPITSQARRLLAFHACHSSVRAGDVMSKRQMKKLLERMANSDFPWNCPHGRPTWCCIHHLNTQPQIYEFEEMENDYSAIPPNSNVFE